MVNEFSVYNSFSLQKFRLRASDFRRDHEKHGRLGDGEPHCQSAAFPPATLPRRLDDHPQERSEIHAEAGQVDVETQTGRRCQNDDGESAEGKSRGNEQEEEGSL